MATGSTASSGTDAPEPQEPGDAPVGAEAAGTKPIHAEEAGTTPVDAEEAAQTRARPEQVPGPAPGHDPARRAFFRQFGKQAVTAVGQVAGMADLVGRTSSGAAASLLGLEPRTAPSPPAFTRSQTAPVVSAVAAPLADDHFRSPFRMADGQLVMLDQRGIPERLEEVSAKRGSDVAYYLRVGVSRGGARMAQEAAYGLALTAAERAGHPQAAREVELRRTRRTLAAARPSARLLGWAMARCEAAAAGFEADDDGPRIAAALRAEADAITNHVQVANAAIAEALAAWLPQPPDRPLGLLIHGDQGALAGGLVGTVTGALRRLREQGRDLRIYLTEARPFMDGARVGSWELRQAGIEHKVITDAAAAWLLWREPIDAVLIGAEWVAANGDVGAIIGSRGVALAAAAARAGSDGVPGVVVSGLSDTIDLGTPDADAIPSESRPARDLTAYLADVPIRATDALVPAADVVPAAAVTAFITERGVAEPLTPAAVAALAGAAEG